MLSRADLDAIRIIVREEVARALGGAPVVRAESPIRDDDSETDPLIIEHATAILAWARSQTAANQRRLLLADAQYMLLVHDPSYQRRARRLFNKGPDEPITVDEMVETIQRRRPTMRWPRR